MQQPPEQAGQPEPINPQINPNQPELVPPARGVPHQSEGELVPPAQSVQPPVQPRMSNATGQQQESSANVTPIQPDRPYEQRSASPNVASTQVPTQMGNDDAGGANARANAGVAPPAGPVAPQGAGAMPASAAGQAREMQTHEEAGRFVTLSSLMHLPVVDLGTGRRLGRVDNIILSSDHRTVEAYTSHGGFLSGTKAFPARGATIGQDAIVLPPGALERFDKRSLRGLPLAGPVTGTRLLSDTGRVLGTVTDIRMDPVTAEVIGYAVNPEDRSLLDRLRHRAAVLPVAAVQRHGTDAWIVAEDDARRHLGG